VVTACKTNRRSRSIPAVILSPNDIHVWRANLDQLGACIRWMSRLLCPAEHDRTDRFRFHRDRHRYIVRRALLRIILGEYLDKEPGSVHIGYGPHGKPYLANSWLSGKLHFSVTHAGGIGLFAFVFNRRIGIDLEMIRPDITYDRIARHFFTAEEYRTLMLQPVMERSRLFFRYWTRKEAYLKGVGTGLFLSPDQIDVSDMSGAFIIPHPSGTAKGKRLPWTWYDLSLGHDFVGALAVEHAAGKAEG